MTCSVRWQEATMPDRACSCAEHDLPAATRRSDSPIHVSDAAVSAGVVAGLAAAWVALRRWWK